jgi:hypothetical protein
MDKRKPFWYLRRRSVDDDVDEELKMHLEMRVDELIASGMAPAEARSEAIRQFGDLETTRRYCREQDQKREDDVQRGLWFQDLLQDVRISVRSLMRAPVLTLTIVATVGIGIGATAAIFSAINAAILRPLPYAEPSALVRVYTDAPPFKFRFSVADYLELIERQTHFAKLATYTDRSMSFRGTDRAELVNGASSHGSSFRCWASRRRWGATSRRPMAALEPLPSSLRVASSGSSVWAGIRASSADRCDSTARTIRSWACYRRSRARSNGGEISS